MNEPRWAIFRRFDIRHPGTRELYLSRLRVVETPWFGVYLHRICTQDPGRFLHDHPWPFVSLVLRGGYYEAVPRGRTWGVRLVRWLSVKRSTDVHRIVELLRTPTWTLVLRGPRWRRWGFETDAGWVDAEAYLSAGGVQ